MQIPLSVPSNKVFLQHPHEELMSHDNLASLGVRVVHCNQQSCYCNDRLNNLMLCC
jgi:hypothetical protein